MSEAVDGRMRLTVLGGFLGSGKTTWLRHQLYDGRLGGALVVVNEAAEVPVDDALLGRSARLEVLAGGCACCDGREALIALLRQICDRRVGGDASAETLDDLVLETSGLADPGPIVETIRADPVLVHHIVVREIVVAIDGLYGLEHMRREPLSRRQIETADRLVVTKVDAAEAASVGRLVATLRQVNPGAAISGAAMGSPAGLPETAGVAAETLPEIGGEAGRPIRAMRLDLDPTVEWTDFTLWLSALLHARGDDLMRVKGVVRTPAGRLLLQSVRKIVQQPEILPGEGGGPGDDDDNSIVLIGRGFRPDDVRRSLAYFTGSSA